MHRDMINKLKNIVDDADGDDNVALIFPSWVCL